MSQTMRRVMMAIAFSILVAGCHRQASPPGDAPTGLNVAPGEGQVVVTWDQQPGLTYWIFYQAGDSVTAAAPGVPIVFDAQSPSIVAGLANATQYAFVMNATNQDSRAGPSTPVFQALPTRLAGNVWTPGTPLGAPAQNLNGVAFGAVPVAGIRTNRIVAVGNAGVIFAGDYNYTNANPVGVTSWTQATTATGTLPAGFASNLSAVIYTGQFVALGADGSVLTSADSVTWTSAASIPIPNTTRMNGLVLGIVSGAARYVAVGATGSIFISTDNLVTWNPATSGTMNELFSVSFLNGIFVATGANGTILTSVDAMNWVPPLSIPSTTNTLTLRSAAFGTGSAAAGARFVVVGDAGTILTSIDGTTWNLTTLSSLQNLRGITFGSRFVAVGQGSTVVYSDDAVNWMSAPSNSGDLAAITFAPAMYVAVGALGANAVSK